jgi:hypothetical protein
LKHVLGQTTANEVAIRRLITVFSDCGMTERSIIAHEYYREASQRFDYFMLAVSTALCAYIGQTLVPKKLNAWPYTLELLSLFVLVGSAVAGFRRIEKTIVSHRLNHIFLDLNEQRGQLITNVSGKPIVNAQTGEIYSPSEINQQLTQLEQEIPKRRNQIETVAAQAKRYYEIRNRLLMIGFLGLVISKMLVPYFP